MNPDDRRDAARRLDPREGRWLHAAGTDARGAALGVEHPHAGLDAQRRAGADVLDGNG